MTIVMLMHHDMPKDWHLADLDHRFWPDFSFLSKPASETTGQDSHFHRLLFLLAFEDVSTRNCTGRCGRSAKGPANE
jgi:hypothetical protein